MSEPSLLGLPPELRFRIYEFAFPRIRTQKKQLFRGSLCDVPGQPSRSRLWHSPWALMRGCRTTRIELQDLMPRFGVLKFAFEDLTHLELQQVIECLGDYRISRLRNFSFSGWAECPSSLYCGFHHVDCPNMHSNGQANEQHHCAPKVDPSEWPKGLLRPVLYDKPAEGNRPKSRKCAGTPWTDSQLSDWLSMAGCCKRELQVNLNHQQLHFAAKYAVDRFWNYAGYDREERPNPPSHLDGVALQQAINRLLWLSCNAVGSDCADACIMERTASESKGRLVKECSTSRAGHLGRFSDDLIDRLGEIHMDAQRLFHLHALCAGETADGTSLGQSLFETWEEYLHS